MAGEVRPPYDDLSLMQLLAIDIGSSSVKCALLRGGKVSGKVVHAPYASRIDGVKVEVDPTVILKAVSKAANDCGDAAKKADAIALSVFSPSWVAMDSKGKPLTPIVTHQDRRSVDVARELEERVGQQKILSVAGTRPFPGGISSTTWAWYLKNEPTRLKKADLVGHLNTFLHRQFTGQRVVDSANASFMGLFRTCDFAGWSDELCQAVGAKASQLPHVRDASDIGGHLTSSAAAALGLREGTPMLVGVVDGSAGMLMTGAKPGQLLNVCGSTDVLALCTDRFAPHPRLLTRALGVGKKWLAVSTIAAAGSAIAWAKEQLFGDLDWPAFQKLAMKLGAKNAGKNIDPAAGVRFEPYLAGDRMTIEQKQAAFTGLTLASKREHILAAILESLASSSAARVTLLKETGLKMSRKVIITGGAGRLTSILHRDWPGKWTYKPEDEATLRGLWALGEAMK